MRGFVADVVGQLGSRVGDDEVVLFTAPGELVAPEAWLGRGGDGVFWDASAWGEDPWVFAGGGATASVEADGAGRFAAVREGGAALLAGVREARAPGCDEVPATRLFGGLAFAEGWRGDEWRGFSDASFVLPRWLYARRGERAFVRLAVRGRELRAPGALLAEIDGCEREACAPATLSDAGDAGDARGAWRDESREAWTALVRAALAAIDEGRFAKLVAARAARLEADRAPDAAGVLARLGAAQRGCARFAFARGGRSFVGATPERLAGLRGGRARIDALAGTRPRGAGGDDEAEARALLASEKDLREHAHVVQGLRATLGALGARVEAADAPRVRTLRQLFHLHTPVEAHFAEPVHALALVAALHPTPAVGGTPREGAATWLAAHEATPRGWYAGPVGWFDAAGEGEFAVALRSAVLGPCGATLFAGAGIVAGSDPDAEYDETEAKFGALRSALQGPA